MENADLGLLTHPVIIKLIRRKAEQFANFYMRLEVLVFTIFTLAWTIQITLFKQVDIKVYDANFYTIAVMTILGQLITFYRVAVVSIAASL